MTQLLKVGSRLAAPAVHASIYVHPCHRFFFYSLCWLMGHCCKYSATLLTLIATVAVFKASFLIPSLLLFLWISVPSPTTSSLFLISRSSVASPCMSLVNLLFSQDFHWRPSYINHSVVYITDQQCLQTPQIANDNFLLLKGLPWITCVACTVQSKSTNTTATLPWNFCGSCSIKNKTKK